MEAFDLNEDVLSVSDASNKSDTGAFLFKRDTQRSQLSSHILVPITSSVNRHKPQSDFEFTANCKEN